MRPIGQIAAIQTSSVLYHSAFGFARVTAVDPERVTLAWEQGTENLPNRVSHDILVRIYALCEPGGFFYRAQHEPARLKEELATSPVDALAQLLADLNGPQRSTDLRDWVVGRKLLTVTGFTHWWKTVLALAKSDPRFAWEGDTLTLRSPDANEDPSARLANPLLAPGRRLDVALELRSQITDRQFLDQVLLAYRTGGTQVRELALAAVRDRSPDEVFLGLLGGGSDGIESIIHAIRRGGWNADQLSPRTNQAILDALLRHTSEGGPLDGEGRLAAALCRWGAVGIEQMLTAISPTTDGRRLLRGTFTSLPQRRGEALALQLLRDALASEDDITARWLGGEALGLALVDAATMADRVDADWPEIADWFRNDFPEVEGRRSGTEDDSFDETSHTAEIDLSGLVDGPVAMSNLPPRSGASLLGLGLGISRALAAHHKDNRIVNPNAESTRILQNETMECDVVPEDTEGSRMDREPPSMAGDVYQAAVLLLEAMLGRRWPRDVPPHRAVPYLRAVIQHLAPSVMAPLDIALHPDPGMRPADGLAWLVLWQQAAIAEESRGYMAPDLNARLQVGYDSHIGRAKVLLGQTNQDALWISTRGPISLLIVCDGISTANAGSGDIASAIASHVVANLWEQALPRISAGRPAEIRDFLDRALRTANTAVCDAALRIAGGNLDGRVPMGTTIVVAYVHGNQVYLAWLGDSRCYLLGSYGASLLSADENQACERLRAWHLGYVEHWEAAGFALVGYLGHFNELTRAEALPAHHVNFTLLPGERLIFMSDGISDYIGEHHPDVSHVIAAVGRQDDLDETARSLVGLANRGGGGDNCTAIVASLW